MHKKWIAVARTQVLCLFGMMDSIIYQPNVEWIGRKRTVIRSSFIYIIYWTGIWKGVRQAFGQQKGVKSVVFPGVNALNKCLLPGKRQTWHAIGSIYYAQCWGNQSRWNDKLKTYIAHYRCEEVKLKWNLQILMQEWHWHTQQQIPKGTNNTLSANY